MIGEAGSEALGAVRERILILDDELPVAQTIGLIAESCGLEARATADAISFFNQLEQFQPDYIALDLVMPGMDGVEVLRQLAAQQCAARIIVVSGMGSRVLTATERSAVEHGLNVIGVISKPFSPQHFRDLIESQRTSRPKVRSAVNRQKNAFHLSEKRLREALENREIALAYQPVIACDSGRIAGLEALARWHHPTEGVIMPDQFIPLAEELGLMDVLTAQILEQALSWFGQHFVAAPATRFPFVEQTSPLAISVNISAKNLKDINFADSVYQLCQNTGVPPESLMLELTETSTMADPILSLDLLTRLRVKGFHLSLDDFGTGYSSMAQLVRLPFSELKVDKSFVMTALASRESRTAVRSIVELGQNLGLRTTAEGLQDSDTLAFLKSVGCDLAQGYFISPALYSDDILRWIRNYRPPAVLSSGK